MSDSRRSAYAALGLAPDATSEQVNEAYRRLAKVVHPDAGGDRHVFAELQNAYALLREPEPTKPAPGSAQPKARAGQHQPQTQSSSTLTGIAGVLYWLFYDSLTFWAILVGVPVIAIWALYNNHPEAAIATGAVTVSLAVAGWWFLRRRER